MGFFANIRLNHRPRNSVPSGTTIFSTKSKFICMALSSWLQRHPSSAFLASQGLGARTRVQQNCGAARVHPRSPSVSLPKRPPTKYNPPQMTAARTNEGIMISKRCKGRLSLLEMNPIAMPTVAVNKYEATGASRTVTTTTIRKRRKPMIPPPPPKTLWSTKATREATPSIRNRNPNSAPMFLTALLPRTFSHNLDID